MKAIAPGKIILSGEHAVVYGKPALVMAVNRYVEVELADGGPPGVTFAFPDIQDEETRAHAELMDQKKAIDARYQEVLDGRRTIREVLEKPMQLIEYAYALFFERYPVPPADPLHIRLTATIPIGCGMGSSAAAVLGLLVGLGGRFDVSPDKGALYEMALQAERMQHGKPSGADPYASLHGGLIRFQHGQAEFLEPVAFPGTLVYTGAPECSTGECVMTVAERFQDDAIWASFEKITNTFVAALQRNDDRLIRLAVENNHERLNIIGVVPRPVREFIDAIRFLGGAAKTCGAGAVRGDAGGMVLVNATEPMDTLCEKFGYEKMEIQGDEHGARIV